MKNLRLLLPGISLFIALLVWSPKLGAQTFDSNVVPPTEEKDTLGTALLQEFNKEFDLVFKSVRNALDSSGYKVNYTSKKRKLIETEFKQLAEEDSFHETMNRYGDVPYMRSPGWTIGRTKITVNFEQIDSARTAVKVLAQLSGYEDRFTNLWHYWRSNGKLEEEVMNAIIKEVEAAE
jgi:hypothetical protein